MQSIITDTYQVHFKENAESALNTHLENTPYSTIFIMVDENTHEHCLAQFMAAIPGNYNFEIIEIESGEINKTIETCTQVWLALSELGADRKSLLINLGGGVLTDMGGFIASTFKRGIAFINVPTTLLSMVDASVGGKTGIDLGPLKNQVGTISQPKMVLIQPNYLKTLEPRQLNSGYAEMLKHGLIQDRNYWDSLQSLNPSELNLEEITKNILTSVAIKNEVVQEDPTEQNLRKILNFGHTLGHAIESYFLESPKHELLLHGEAIAIGMVLEAYISHIIHAFPLNDLVEIKKVFKEQYAIVNFTETDIEAILDYLKFDKKNSHGNINFVLLKEIGSPVWDCLVDNQLILKSFSYYKED